MATAQTTLVYLFNRTTKKLYGRVEVDMEPYRGEVSVESAVRKALVDAKIHPRAAHIAVCPVPNHYLQAAVMFDY